MTTTKTPKASKATSDAISLIKSDHHEVELLFKKYESLSDRAYKAKKNVIDQIVRELSIHTMIEETVLYPRSRAELEGVDDNVLEAVEEHMLVKHALVQLSTTDVSDERLDARFKVLSETVRHHVKEEERNYLPKLRQAYSKSELIELGEQLAVAKKTASRHPHLVQAAAPTELLAAGASGLIDRAREAGGDAIQRVREAVTN